MRSQLPICPSLMLSPFIFTAAFSKGDDAARLIEFMGRSVGLHLLDHGDCSCGWLSVIPS